MEMFKEKFDLSGKTALVTGSTRGIGKAIGDAFEEYGAKVIRHNTKVCDLSDPAAIEVFLDALERDGSLPDILVANASIQAKVPWTQFPMDEARKELQVNFLATLRMFQRCYPKMKRQGWGRLIVLGSVNERRPHPDMCVYAATKSAQENLVRGIARQVAAEGITVNNLSPGVFYTDRNKECLADPVYGPKVTAAIPMHRYAMPEDAAGAALLLASDAGSYITGATIMVDGGLCLPG
ncbi:MAG: SDR family oxidoreductase [Kiritimatiellae bacterium]|nr:SDR family oxidoreductase [Kiritimatiellia bacterium]